MIKKNKFFKQEKWRNKSAEERNDGWKWARNSTEAKASSRLKLEFLYRVKGAKLLALKEKEKMKKRKLDSKKLYRHAKSIWVL